MSVTVEERFMPVVVHRKGPPAVGQSNYVVDWDDRRTMITYGPDQEKERHLAWPRRSCGR